MRSTVDLVDELCEEAPKFMALAIVVGFRERREFVWYHQHSDKAGMVYQLVTLMRAGGEPIGLLGWRRPTAENQSGLIYHRVFAELAGEEWVEKYLTKLERGAIEAGMARGIIKGATKIGRG